MIDLPSDIDDNISYHLLPQEDRWIYNKLIVAEKMGYTCGPAGMDLPAPGKYCIRPVMNSYGYGYPGFVEYDFRDVQPDYYPGFFWCEWFDGDKQWLDFTDDALVLSSTFGNKDADGWISEIDGVSPVMTTLPAIFQNISKHMLVELVGDKIIEVSPRHMFWRQPRGVLKTRLENSEDTIRWPGKMWAAN